MQNYIPILNQFTCYRYDQPQHHQNLLLQTMRNLIILDSISILKSTGIKSCFDRTEQKQKFLFGNNSDDSGTQKRSVDICDGNCQISEDSSTIENSPSSLKDQDSVCSSPVSKDTRCCESKLNKSINYEKDVKTINKISNSKKITKKTKSKRKLKNDGRSCERLKNIVKNYGKNCALFAISEIAQEFRFGCLGDHQISRFTIWIKEHIPTLTNIANFREMLLVTNVENSEIASFKQAFQYLSEIFVKDYAHNWIFQSSRIKDVKGYIFARYKMLRRIRNPKNFTYVH